MEKINGIRQSIGEWEHNFGQGVVKELSEMAWWIELPSITDDPLGHRFRRGDVLGESCGGPNRRQ